MSLRIIINFLISTAISVFSISAYSDLPTLDQGKFFASSSLFNASGWSYTGTLPSSINAGFKADNIEDGFFYDNHQYASGSRTMTTTTGTTPSYKLEFKGAFENEDFENWEGSLLAQSQGIKFNTATIDSIKFIGSGQTTDEHPIPEAWRSNTGYGTPNGMYAKFNQTYTLSQSYLNPGQDNCPVFIANTGSKTDYCGFTEAYFTGGVDLSANVQAAASIADPVLSSTQSVNIDATANRLTTIKVNGDAVFSGDINGSNSTFHLEEEKVKSANLSFTANFEQKTVNLSGGVTWDGRDETSSFNASYVKSFQMSDYANVGKTDQYVVEVRDTPQLIAGIDGKDFTSASVSVSASLNAIDSVLKPVFQPFSGGRLAILDASTFNLKSPDLPIPPGGFTGDLPVFLHFLLANEGSMDLTIDNFNFSLKDEDIFTSDDILGTLSKTNLNLTLKPGTSLDYGFYLTVSQDALNAARTDKFPFFSDREGNALDLIGSGSFQFHDLNGSRTKSFTLAIPEPGELNLLLIGVFSLLPFLARTRKIPN